MVSLTSAEEYREIRKLKFLRTAVYNTDAEKHGVIVYISRSSLRKFCAISQAIVHAFFRRKKKCLCVYVDCTSRHARWTSLIIQWSPDSTDCFNKRQLNSRVARRTLLSTETYNVSAVRLLYLHSL